MQVGTLNSNKLILTGSSGLIGRTLSTALSNCGYDVINADLSLGIDLTDSNIRSEFFSTHNDVPYLVNCIGLNHHITVPSTEKATIFTPGSQSLLQYFLINTLLVHDICREFSNKTTCPRSIVNFGSLYAELSPRPDIYGDSVKDIGYTVSKHGLLGLTRQLATHLAPLIRVNMVSPGGVIADQNPEFLSQYTKNCPAGRLLEPEDIVGTVQYLCSDMSTMVTGQNIIVDGGWSII